MKSLTKWLLIRCLIWCSGIICHAVVTYALLFYGGVMLGGPEWFIRPAVSFLLFPELCLSKVDLGFFDRRLAGCDQSLAAILQNSLCWVAAVVLLWRIVEYCCRLLASFLSSRRVVTHS
jgi:hypothetical protein